MCILYELFEKYFDKRQGYSMREVVDTPKLPKQFDKNEIYTIVITFIVVLCVIFIT